MSRRGQLPMAAPKQPPPATPSACPPSALSASPPREPPEHTSALTLTPASTATCVISCLLARLFVLLDIYLTSDFSSSAEAGASRHGIWPPCCGTTARSQRGFTGRSTEICAAPAQATGAKGATRAARAEGALALAYGRAECSGQHGAVKCRRSPEIKCTIMERLCRAFGFVEFDFGPLPLPVGRKFTPPPVQGAPRWWRWWWRCPQAPWYTARHAPPHGLGGEHPRPVSTGRSAGAPAHAPFS